MLEVKGVSAGYGKLPVINDVDFVAKPGEITLLLGPNGAGKTTFMKTIGGLVSARTGAIEFNGESLVGLKPEQVASRGVRLVLEGHRIFPALSVQDNLRLGQLVVPRGDRVPLADVHDQVFGVFPILGEKRKLPASSLSGGQQQMLALAQAWTSNPDVLMCDEPSLGLAQSLIPEILEFLKARADEGMTVVLVEQVVDLPLQVADRVVFFRQGSVLSEGPPEQFMDSEYTANLMLGAGV